MQSTSLCIFISSDKVWLNTNKANAASSQQSKPLFSQMGNKKQFSEELSIIALMLTDWIVDDKLLLSEELSLELLLSCDDFGISLVVNLAR